MPKIINGYEIKPGADLQCSNLRGVGLSGLDLKKIDFQEAVLVNVNFSRADIKKTNFQLAYLFNADFQEADLKKTDFQWADLRWANFKGADLRKADFRKANLRWANFKGALLDGADFEGSDLRWATFGEEFKMYNSVKYVLSRVVSINPRVNDDQVYYDKDEAIEASKKLADKGCPTRVKKVAYTEEWVWPPEELDPD